ncbi:MAG: hypothetical protein Q7N50_02020 [Armatimonadota bacterium]|nr:hypothetical protein [Armatimonadota bacterium]
MNSSDDNLQRRAAVDKLLTMANAHRVRGDLLAAEDACREALAIEPENLRTGEMLGDILYALGKLQDAMRQYHSLMEQDSSFANAERKYAKVALEIAELEREKQTVKDFIDKPDHSSARRNANIALILSFAAPGIGQIYNGELIKGAILFGSFLLSVIVIALSSSTSLFIKQVFTILFTAGSSDDAAPISAQWPSIWLMLFLGIGAFSYLASIIDIAVTASRHKRAEEKKAGKS